jgi:hypothetical protein
VDKTSWKAAFASPCEYATFCLWDSQRFAAMPTPTAQTAKKAARQWACAALWIGLLAPCLAIAAVVTPEWKTLEVDYGFGTATVTFGLVRCCAEVEERGKGTKLPAPLTFPCFYRSMKCAWKASPAWGFPHAR